MQLGGVILGAGMVLELTDDDYLYPVGALRFTVQRIMATTVKDGEHMVLLEGVEKVPEGPWRNSTIVVRVSSLSRCLRLGLSR